MRWKSIIPVCLSAALCSCASVVGWAEYDVALTSEPPNAHYIVSDMQGTEVVTGNTPDVVRLHASSGYFKRARYNIEMAAEGYQVQTRELRATITPLYFGNYFTLPLFGLAGFLVIDPLTGAMYELPEQFPVTLQPLTDKDAVPKPVIGTPATFVKVPGNGHE